MGDFPSEGTKTRKTETKVGADAYIGPIFKKIHLLNELV